MAAPATTAARAGNGASPSVRDEAAVRAQLQAEAEQLRGQLAAHDSQALALQDRVYAAEGAGDQRQADKLRAKLHTVLAHSGRISNRLQALATDAEVSRRVQALEQRQRSRARLDTYLASKEEAQA